MESILPDYQYIFVDPDNKSGRPPQRAPAATQMPGGPSTRLVSLSLVLSYFILLIGIYDFAQNLWIVAFHAQIISIAQMLNQIHNHFTNNTMNKCNPMKHVFLFDI
jgi:hypothetical protein